MSKVFEYTLNELPTAYVDGSLSGSGSATIAVYDGGGNSIALDSDSCTELGSTGVFVFQLSNFTTAPTSYSVYTYIISRGANDFFGTIKIGSQDNPADTCKVTADIFEPRDDSIQTNSLYSQTQKAYAQITSTYYQSASTKYFTLDQVKPSYDQITGQSYWIFPQGASVKFFIKQLGINSTVTIPASSTASLNTLLSA
jgi:hypothetical protein